MDKQKDINKETELNNAIKQLNLKDIYRTRLRTTAGYTFFSSAHGILSTIDHMLGHKTTLNTFKRTEITQSIFSTTREQNYKISNRKKFGMFTNM